MLAFLMQRNTANIADILRQRIITPQGIINSFDIFKPHMSQPTIIRRILFFRPHSGLPLLAQLVVIPGTKPNTPPLENDHLDRILAKLINRLPFLPRHAIPLSRKRSFIVLRDRSGLAGAQRRKDLLA